MKKALLLAACLLAASLAGCGKEQSELYDRGMDAMEQQDYVTAIGMFQGAIEAEERLAEGYRAIGIAYLESAEYESAAEAFQNSRNAMEHKNEEFQKDVMMYQAQALQLAGNTDQALEIYDQVVEAFPDGDVYLSRGSLHLTRKEYDGAKEDFEKALNENRSYEMCLKIYQLYQDSSMKADGDAFLEQATQISPNDAEDYYELGCVYYYLEDTEKAKEVLEQAMDEEAQRLCPCLEMFIWIRMIPRAPESCLSRNWKEKKRLPLKTVLPSVTSRKRIMTLRWSI